jgi:pSer/pThr/pTyr-binding forkhead associated (FHA) protein/tetratricopeptide (TPR) repeat protein
VKLIVLKNNVPLNEILVDTTDINEMHEIYVGRSEDCHVQIEDPLISRHHFVLKNENFVWYCEKLSQLGTVSLNGVLVTKNPIHDGDEVKCGTYSVLVTELPSLIPKLVVPVETPVYAIAEPVNDLTELISEPLDAGPVMEPEQESENIAESLVNQEEVLSDNEQESNQPAEEFQEMESFDIESLEDNDFSAESPSLDEEVNADFGSDLVDDPAGFGSETVGDDNFGMELSDTDNESTRVLKAFVNYQLVLFGEHAPYDRFFIEQDEIFIGRDANKCQILLNDPEVSSVHAVLRKNLTEITLEDLNSSNGTILNAERINKAQITPGDEFVIGGTSFTLEVRSDLLESESDRLMPVETGQVIETEEVEEEIVMMDGDGDISFDSEATPEKSIIKRIWKDPAKRKRLIIVVFILAMGWLFLEDEEPVPTTTKKEVPAQDKKTKPKLVLSKELEQARNLAYELGVSFFEQSRYDQAEPEFQKVVSIDPEYKKVQSYLEQTRSGMARLAELENQRRAEEERVKTKKLIDELLVKAREAVKEKQVSLAESYFSQIIEKDPENIEVSQLKLELESWQKEQEKLALERAARETARKKMVDALSPGKTYYLKKEWYRAILKLEEFLRIKGTDEDLIKDASDMLSDSKNQLASDLGPLLGKARSLKEGQDLKSAYEAYLDVLKIEPTNTESLNEVDDIKSQLDSRSKRIYREAIIAESLSLFTDAKEKFQEVQQISPTDSEYYKKANEKLKDYLE